MIKVWKYTRLPWNDGNTLHSQMFEKHELNRIIIELNIRDNLEMKSEHKRLAKARKTRTEMKHCYVYH